MKPSLITLFLPTALMTGLGLFPAYDAATQTFTNLHNFPTTFGASSTNTEGASPFAALVLSGTTLYGMATYGGKTGNGTVFAITTNGTGFTNLYNFTTGAVSQPRAGLVLSGNTLYGTASSIYGAVFKVTTNGSNFTTLHGFTATSGPTPTNSDGASPQGGLVLSGGSLYGTAASGGGSGYGTVFKLNTNGAGFTNLHTFTAISGSTNNDGASPIAGLILSGNTLYGSASQGGAFGFGAVFAVNTDGTGFTNLHSFSLTSDGGTPYGGPILSGNTLYGTAYRGGSLGFGTVFAVNTNGTGFTNLHSFSSSSDGANPFAGLSISGDMLLGSTVFGGSASNGTVFAISTNGTSFTNLHSFIADSGFNSTNSEGANPYGGLVFAGNLLCGTAFHGGSSGYGTVFGLSFPLPPQLAIILSGANIILTWPTSPAGFVLQSTTNLFLGIPWGTVSPAPTLVNGRNAVTNPLSGTQKFYRLTH